MASVKPKAVIMPGFTGIGLIGIACQRLAWRVKLPAVLFLTLADIVAGPLTEWLKEPRSYS